MSAKVAPAASKASRGPPGLCRLHGKVAGSDQVAFLVDGDLSRRADRAAARCDEHLGEGRGMDETLCRRPFDHALPYASEKTKPNRIRLRAGDRYQSIVQ